MEPHSKHHRPHFHAYYQEQIAIFGIDEIEMISGYLSKRQKRLVEAWVELHQDELLEDWKLLQAGKSPVPVKPLR